MSTKYQQSKRCYLIDHHSPQPPIVPLNHLDINEYEQFFDTANIDSLMVYCKDHWGVTYYDSKVEGAQKHRGVTTDWIQEVSLLLKKKAIEFVAYYCIEYDEGAARLHPDWRVYNSDGTPLIRDDEFAKWSLCCYQTGYREYCLQQLEEIVTNYHPDSIFMDIFGASLCYCPTCKQKFMDKYGYPLPEQDADMKQHRSDIVEFLNQNAKGFLSEVNQRLKAIDPTLAITVNFSCHYPKDIRDMLDYQFSEPLLKDNWFSSAYARDTAIGQFPILVPGEASQVYNYHSLAEYTCDLSSIAAQGCRVGMYSGSQHIDGTLDHEEARLLGSVFSEIKKMEPYFVDRQPVKCIGIIQSDSSMSINLEKLYPDAILRMKNHNPHQDSVLGAMQLCETEKMPYMIIPEASVTDSLLASYDLILLPEVYVISDSLKTHLDTYVQNGGCLISSFQTGMWNYDSSVRKSSSLSKLFGISEGLLHTEYSQNRWSAYLNSSDNEHFHGLLSCTTPPVSECFMETKTSDSAKALLHFTLPCVACTSSEWVNWWSPPPGSETNYPALIHHQYGKGESIYLAFDYFQMASSGTYNYTSSLFHDLVKMLGIKPCIYNQLETPNLIRTAYFETKDQYIIHQISMLPKLTHGDTAAIHGGTLKFSTPISSAQLVYPDNHSLPLSVCDTGSVSVNLPDFSLQQIVVCDKVK